jgi:CHAT domain-containing protein
MNNLAHVAYWRGNLVRAEELFRCALVGFESLAPEGFGVAAAWTNLGNVARDRGDLETAEAAFNKGLDLFKRVAPGTRYVAGTLADLGTVAAYREDWPAAESYFKRALEIRTACAPDGIETAMSMSDLGSVAEARGDLEAAADYYRRDVEITQRHAAASLSSARGLCDLGVVARKQGDLERAQSLLSQALGIRHRLAPESSDEAEILHELGIVSRERGRKAEAVESFERAVEVLDAQMGKLGGSEEVRSRFRANRIDYFRDLIELLLEIDRPEDAFHVLERSRAHELLSMLSARDLVFAADIPEELDRERRIVNATYQRLCEERAELSEDDAEEAVALTGQINDLRRQRDEIESRIRERSPRLAGLVRPQALDLDGARKVIEPGTTVLSYCVGRESTHLFILASDGGFRVISIGLGEDDLRRRIVVFRGLIEGQRDPVLVRSAGAGLYQDLIAPAEDEVEDAERLLIVPDGPLLLLPFCTLTRELADKRTQYLVEWKALSQIVSLTVLGQLGEASRPPDKGSIVAFADPAFEPSRRASGLVFRGSSLTPLPATRIEVKAIARLYGDAATVWTGRQATEARVRQIGRDIDIVHFATHVTMNERAPLESAIALTAAGEDDDGLMQAWEVLESIRLDARLVALSGCHSAGGGEVAGEGMVGLVWAFQFAGSRSVLASLWQVEDVSTAELMTSFYSHLREGAGTAQSLRQAQLALIRGNARGRSSKGFWSWLRGLVDRVEREDRDPSHPFFWGAFVLQGSGV